jgi:hypothetical protein
MSNGVNIAEARVRFPVSPPNETLSELRKWSDFAEAKIALSIFSKLLPTAEAVNFQSSSQLHESVLSLRIGFEPIFWKNSLCEIVFAFFQNNGFSQRQNKLPQGFDPIFSLLSKILKTLLKLCFLTKEKVFSL